jgi:hypothetical protein
LKIKISISNFLLSCNNYWLGLENIFKDKS